MVQQEVELILMRQLASYLAMPIIVVDSNHNLLFYNEPAEAILGRRFDETGEMSLEEWAAAFPLHEEGGAPLPLEARPLVIALRERRPGHRTLRITGLDGVTRRIGTTTFPLEGQGGRHLGAVAIFWELEE